MALQSSFQHCARIKCSLDKRSQKWVQHCPVRREPSWAADSVASPEQHQREEFQRHTMVEHPMGCKISTLETPCLFWVNVNAAAPDARLRVLNILMENRTTPAPTTAMISLRLNRGELVNFQRGTAICCQCPRHINLMRPNQHHIRHQVRVLPVTAQWQR